MGHIWPAVRHLATPGIDTNHYCIDGTCIVYSYVIRLFQSQTIFCTPYNIHLEIVHDFKSWFLTMVSWNQDFEFPSGRSIKILFLLLLFYKDVFPQISPATSTVSLNGQTELRCMTSSSNDGSHSITWYKDGRVMAGRAQRDVLRLVSVSRADCGTYQCLVRRGDGETAQSAATVRLGGE